MLSKLKGGALIIENAGGLESSTLMALSLAMEGDTGGLLIILEGTEEDIQKIFLKNKNFASKLDVYKRQALIRAVRGDVEHGLIFCGDNAAYLDHISTVPEVIASLFA